MFIDYVESAGDDNNSGYQVFVWCGKCGEPFMTRIDLAHDLSMVYTEYGD